MSRDMARLPKSPQTPEHSLMQTPRRHRTVQTPGQLLGAAQAAGISTWLRYTLSWRSSASMTDA